MIVLRLGPGVRTRPLRAGPQKRRVLRGDLPGIAEHRDVDEAGVAAGHVLNRDPQAADAVAVSGGVERGVAREPAGELCYLELRRRGFGGGERGHVVAFLERGW